MPSKVIVHEDLSNVGSQGNNVININLNDKFDKKCNISDVYIGIKMWTGW